MSTTDLAFATVQQLHSLLAKKKLSPVELTQLYLSRIESLDPRLNAFRTVTRDRALADARKAERELLRGHIRGPLHGIPIALKDNIQTRGIRTTAGSVILGSYVPDEDAAIARRLRTAGTVLLGKTNLHEFAYGITSENPHYGATHNPWAHDRISGGSSGGSATAIAAGLCAAAVGTDTGGSIRVPAALCGIFGLKPTFGRVSTDGVFPLVPTFDHVGPLARCAADAAILLDALAGPGWRAAAGRSRQTNNILGAGVTTLKRVRLGRPREFFWDRLDPQVRRLCEAALQDIMRAGAVVEEIALPITAEIEADTRASNTVALVEARRVHERAGFFPARQAEYGADVRERLAAGGEIRAIELLRMREAIARSTAEFEGALTRVDAIVSPAVPIPAPRIGAQYVILDGRKESVRAALVRLNRPGNFTGLPALSVPCGYTKDVLPVGLQLIGKRGDESTILRVAHRYEQAHDWASAHPG